MNSTQVVLKCTLLVALIISCEIHIIHGRQLRPILNNHDLNRRKIQGSNQQVMNNRLDMKDSAADQHDKDAFRPTKPGNSPGAGHAFEQISSPKGNGRQFVTTETKDNFRPTAPGISPGAGHAFEQISTPNGNAEDKNDDFQPTEPGN